MKKAKIMLSAIAVLAIVGGALAFKANKANTIALLTGTAQTSCPTADFLTSTTDDTQIPTWATTLLGNTKQCVFTYTTINQ